MDGIPSISTSAQNALTAGFAKLDVAANEIVSASQSRPATTSDTVDLRAGNVSDADPMITGIRDLMMAKTQVGAGILLLHAYRDNRQDLFDMLAPDRPGT